ncbi:MAG: hypothetical protein ACRYFU_15660 [Janthinobacterium lividum]
MSIPDFERAQYVEPKIIEGYSGDYRPGAGGTAFPKAILFGLGAAVVGAVGYALIGLSGWMVSIVVIGIAWFITKAMMTATGGVGGRPYQIAACLLTYFAATTGRLIDILHVVRAEAPISYGALIAANLPMVIRYIVAGPLLRLKTDPINGGLGLLILFFGLRTAWQMAAGSPGFGSTGGPRPGVFGMR